MRNLKQVNANDTFRTYKKKKRTYTNMKKRRSLNMYRLGRKKRRERRKLASLARKNARFCKSEVYKEREGQSQTYKMFLRLR